MRKSKLISLNNIKQKLKVDDFQYPYIDTEFSDMNSKISILCVKHGMFKQDMLHHLTRNQGCKECGIEASKLKQIRKSKPGGNLVNYYTLNEEKGKLPGKLYSLKLYNDNEIFYKIGVTSQSIKNRFCRIPYKYEVLKVLELSNLEVCKLEETIHAENKELQYKPNEKFNGYTECYYKEIKI